MSEKNITIILLFVCLSFSAFLIGYFLTGQEIFKSTQGTILSGFTPIPSPIENLKKSNIDFDFPKIYITKKGNISTIKIGDKKILETRLPDPILEWKDENTLYLKSVKNGEAVTFLLTLDGQLTQIK